MHCIFCDQDLPSSAFRKNSLFESGLQPYCKPCAKITSPIPVIEGEYKCSSCSTIKPHTEFSPGIKANGLSSQCKYCAAKRRGAYYQRNKEGINKEKWQSIKTRMESDPEYARKVRADKREQKRKYRARHPWRVRIQRHNEITGQHINSVAFEKWVEECGECCARCGGSDRLEIDHIIPRWLDGENALDNLQLLCRVCHRKKTLGFSIDYLRKRIYVKNPELFELVSMPE